MGTALSHSVRPHAVPALRLKLSSPGWKASIEQLDRHILEPNVHREPLMQLQSQATRLQGRRATVDQICHGVAVDAVGDVVPSGHEDRVVPVTNFDRRQQVCGALTKGLDMPSVLEVPGGSLATIAHSTTVPRHPGFIVNSAVILSFRIEVCLIAANTISMGI